ncbi:hypothetical protein [Magnetospirillum fulvum]|uniref:hypothetical protein n=1 Tax=Magnetospirillum fulvum TaxID=1082 RepID=UPI0012DC5FE2|nr:hypothetical protein [Magnetospirillum fulvum]
MATDTERESGNAFPWLGTRIDELRETIEAGDGTGHDLAELTVLREALKKLERPTQPREQLDQQNEIFSGLMEIETDLIGQGLPSLRVTELILEGAVSLAATTMAAGRLEAVFDDALKRLQTQPQPTPKQPSENGRPSWCRGVIDRDQLPQPPALRPRS